MNFKRTQHDHATIDRLLLRLEGGPKAGASQAWNDLWTTLCTRMDEHFRDEEKTLFPQISHALPAYTEDMRMLCAQHRNLQRVAKRVDDADSDKGRQDAFLAFRKRFAAHSIVESDALHRAWDELFVGRRDEQGVWFHP